uniref:30S ribosomal protein S1 n=1 Tax=Corynoplastis japonica TaxID=700918 RepID=A0A1X9PTX7_9RHOD|nr:30S ribosomal protein S1 [Corynoplastis japonica]
MIKKFTQKNFATVIKYNYDFKSGDIVAGTIFSLELQGALVDVGSASVAYVSSSFDVNLTINSVCEFLVLYVSKQSNLLILSIRALAYIRAWKRIKQMNRSSDILVSIEGLKGFIPNSHIISKQMISTLEYDNFFVKFLEVDEKTNNLVLSHRCALLQLEKTNFSIGQIVIGIIQEIQDYGLFIDLGNIKGLLHISEISDNYIPDLKKVFKIGDRIKVMISKILFIFYNNHFLYLSQILTL